MNDFISTAPLHGDYLAHYGIKGQKWGIRRYQNPDGTLTAEGKARAKKEYKEDNAEAKRLGNNATAANYAVRKSDAALIRKQRDHEQHGSARTAKNLAVEKETNKRLREIRDASVKEAEKHFKSLSKKYGQVAMKDIRRNANGEIDERRNSIGKSALIWGLNAVGYVAMSMIGSPVSPIYIPRSNRSVGGKLRNTVKGEVEYEMKN